MRRMNVNVMVILDENAAVAHASLAQADLESGDFVHDESTGSAKREPGDPRNDMIAVSLATGRALVKLGERLQETAGILVEHAMTTRDMGRKISIARQLTKGMKRQALLPVAEIAERYGKDAAERAARRRGQGKHARPEE
jgi:hypothetical protein